MNTYEDFNKAVLKHKVDISNFCKVASIQPEDVTEAKATNKLPNFIALSLMKYIDDIQIHQP